MPDAMRSAPLIFPFERDKTVVDGRFVIKGELGQGGMGRCYFAFQSNLDRTCVLKMLAPKLHPRFVKHADARAMLENEARTLGLLAEGNDSFVNVFDRGTLYALVRHEDLGEIELDLPYYTMEYLHGITLAVLIDKATLKAEFFPFGLILPLCKQMAEALVIMHSRGVIHRDIKPDNIVLNERIGRPLTVKVIDLGVSRREGDPVLAGTGTIRYGTPELLAGKAALESTQSDIYPLGLVFYEFVALRGPHVCETAQAYFFAHVNIEAPNVLVFRPDCPPRFAKLITWMLMKDPRKRPTARQVADELTAIIGELGTAGARATSQLSLSGLLPPSQQAAAQRQRTTLHMRPALVRSVLQPAASPGAMPLHSFEIVASHPMPDSVQPAASRTAPVAPASARASGSEADASASRGKEPVQPFGQNPSVRPLPEEPALVQRHTVRMSPVPSASPSPPSVAPQASSPPAAIPTPVIQPAPSVIVGDPLPSPLTTTSGGIHDIPNVPAFRSMGQMIDALWEDDTRYQPSAADTADMPKLPVSVVRERALAHGAAHARRKAEAAVTAPPAQMTPLPRGETPLSVSRSHPTDTTTSRRAPTVPHGPRWRRMVPISVIGACAVALLAAGAIRISRRPAMVDPVVPASSASAVAPTATTSASAVTAATVPSIAVSETASAAPAPPPAPREVAAGPTSHASAHALASVPKLPPARWVPPAPTKRDVGATVDDITDPFVHRPAPAP
jgi:serine/threonine protein kinase